jgi:hypothetical protein
MSIRGGGKEQRQATDVYKRFTKFDTEGEKGSVAVEGLMSFRRHGAIGRTSVAGSCSS